LLNLCIYLMKDCIPQQKADYRLEQLDDELLLYHPNQTVIMYCNAIASLVWQLCDGQRTVHEISNLLSAAYDKPYTVVAPQIETALQEFYQQRAIEYVGDTLPTQKSP